MKTTTIMVANAIVAGVQSHFCPLNQIIELEKLHELFLDMAATLEMDNASYCHGTQNHDTEVTSMKKVKYANVLGDIAQRIEPSGQSSSRMAEALGEVNARVAGYTTQLLKHLGLNRDDADRIVGAVREAFTSELGQINGED